MTGDDAGRFSTLGLGPVYFCLGSSLLLARVLSTCGMFGLRPPEAGSYCCYVLLLLPLLLLPLLLLLLILLLQQLGRLLLLPLPNTNHNKASLI